MYICNEPEYFGEDGGASLTGSGNLTVSSGSSLTMQTSGTGSVYIENCADDIGEYGSSNVSDSLNTEVTSGGSLTMSSSGTGNVFVCNFVCDFSSGNTGTASTALNSMDLTVSSAGSLQMASTGTGASSGNVYILNWGPGQKGDFTNVNNVTVTAGGNISLTSAAANTGSVSYGVVNIGSNSSVVYHGFNPSTGVFSNFGNLSVTSTGGSISMNGIDTFMEADGPNSLTGNLTLASAGGIGITNLQGSGIASLTAAGGAIANNGGVTAPATLRGDFSFNGTNITSGGNLSLSGTGIGSSSSAITASTGTGSSTLTAVTTGSGSGDYITEAEDLGAVSVTTNNGVVDIPFGSSLLTFDPTAELLTFNVPGTDLVFANTGGSISGSSVVNVGSLNTASLEGDTGIGSASGPLDVSNIGVLLLASAPNGSIYLSDTGALTFETISALGTVSINAGGSISGLTGSLLSGNAADLVSGGSIEGAGGAALATMVSDLNASASGGDILLNNTAGTLTIGVVTASGGVEITNSGSILLDGITAGGGVDLSAGGNILDSANSTAPDITAGGNSVLTAGGVIGTDTDPLRVEVNGTISVAASGILNYVSVDMNGTDTGMMLDVLNSPPGFVIFNGNPQSLNPEDVGLIIGNTYYEGISQNNPYIGVIPSEFITGVEESLVNPCYSEIQEPLGVKGEGKKNSSSCLESK